MYSCTKYVPWCVVNACKQYCIHAIMQRIEKYNLANSFFQPKKEYISIGKKINCLVLSIF